MGCQGSPEGGRSSEIRSVFGVRIARSDISGHGLPQLLKGGGGGGGGANSGLFPRRILSRAGLMLNLEWWESP